MYKIHSYEGNLKPELSVSNVLPLVYEIINHSAPPSSSEMTNKMRIMWHDER